MVSPSSSLLKLQLLAIAASSVIANINGIDQRDMMEEMEHLLVDNGGTNSVNFVSAVSPCSQYITGNQFQGEQTSAQWVRFAFHDFVTADLKAGTG